MNPSLDSISNYFAEFMSFRMFPNILLILEQYTTYFVLQLLNTSYYDVVSILLGSIGCQCCG